MRWIFLVFTNFLVINLIVAVVLLGHSSSRFKICEQDLVKLNYGIEQQQVLSLYGTPYLHLSNRWVYRGEHDSLLTLTWENEILVSAELTLAEFVSFKQISHVENNKLMALETPDSLIHSGWLKIGVPSQGIVLQVNRNGEVSKMTWVKPWEAFSGEQGILSILDRLNELPPYAYN